MTTTDRYYYIRSLGESKIRPGAAGTALEAALAGHSLCDEYERTVIQAMSDCHIRAMELVANNGTAVMFNPDLHNDWLLRTIPTGYQNQIRYIITETMRKHHAENIYGIAINACARYINLIVRLDIANGRRCPEVTLRLSEILTKTLNELKGTKTENPDEEVAHFRNMMATMRVYTAHYMDIRQISDDDGAKYAKAAIQQEYGT